MPSAPIRPAGMVRFVPFVIQYPTTREDGRTGDEARKGERRDQPRP